MRGKHQLRGIAHRSFGSAPRDFSRHARHDRLQQGIEALDQVVGGQGLQCALLCLHGLPKGTGAFGQLFGCGGKGVGGLVHQIAKNIRKKCLKRFIGKR